MAVARPSFRSWWRGDVAMVAAAVIVVIWGWTSVLPARFEMFRSGLATLKLHPERELAARGERRALIIVPERWGSRLVVGLWELGVRPGLAERAYDQVDACDLQGLLDSARAEHMSAQATTAKLEGLIRATPVQIALSPRSTDQTLHLRPGRALTPACQREQQHDQAGFTLYGHLAWRNDIGLNSGLVFARDLFDRNGELFTRYSGWPVWRFAPPAGGAPDAPPVLTRVPSGVAP
jgi:hypothetical protein